MNPRAFQNRQEAGRRLARALQRREPWQDALVLGLPRGGVPVAYEVAQALRLPLDVLVVRKLGVPGWEELAMGAVASGGVRVLNDPVIRSCAVPPAVLEAAVAAQIREVERREIAFRGHPGAPDVAGRRVLLVDDGLATGATVRAAVAALRGQGAAQIVVAVPTASREACALLEQEVDALVTLLRPDDFSSVGQWYEDFTQTTDTEVTDLLKRAARRPPAVPVP